MSGQLFICKCGNTISPAALNESARIGREYPMCVDCLVTLFDFAQEERRKARASLRAAVLRAIVAAVAEIADRKKRRRKR